MSLISSLRHAVMGLSLEAEQRPIRAFLEEVRDYSDRKTILNSLRKFDLSINLEDEVSNSLVIDLSPGFAGLKQSDGYGAQRIAMEQILESYLPKPFAGMNLFINEPVLEGSTRFGFILGEDGKFLHVKQASPNSSYVLEDLGWSGVNKNGLMLMARDEDFYPDAQEMIARLWTAAEKSTGRAMMMPRDRGPLIECCKEAFQQALNRACDLSTYGCMDLSALYGSLPRDLHCFRGIDTRTIQDRKRINAIVEAIGPIYDFPTGDLDEQPLAIWEYCANEGRLITQEILSRKLDVDKTTEIIRGHKRLNKFAQALRWLGGEEVGFKFDVVELLKDAPDSVLVSAYGAEVPKNPAGFAPWINPSAEIAGMKISMCDKLIRTTISNRFEITQLGANLRNSLRAYGGVGSRNVSDSTLSRMISDIADHEQLAHICENRESEGILRVLGAQAARMSDARKLDPSYTLLMTLDAGDLSAFAETARWSTLGAKSTRYLEERLARGAYGMPDYFAACIEHSPRNGEFATKHLISLGIAMEEANLKNVDETLLRFAKDLSQRTIIHEAGNHARLIERKGHVDEMDLAWLIEPHEPERYLMQKIHIECDSKLLGDIQNEVMSLAKLLGPEHGSLLDDVMNIQDGFDPLDYKHLLNEANRVISAKVSEPEVAIASLFAELVVSEDELSPGF